MDVDLSAKTYLIQKWPRWGTSYGHAWRIDVERAFDGRATRATSRACRPGHSSRSTSISPRWKRWSGLRGTSPALSFPRRALRGFPIYLAGWMERDAKCWRDLRVGIRPDALRRCVGEWGTCRWFSTPSSTCWWPPQRGPTMGGTSRGLDIPVAVYRSALAARAERLTSLDV